MRGTGFSSTGSSVMKLIFINVAVYLIQGIYRTKMVPFEIPFNGQVFVQNYPEITYYFGLTPAIVVTKYYVWQIGTYMFLHGGFSHIFLNMYALMLFGIPVEQFWGTRKFLFYYFFTGIGAGLIIFTMNYFSGGASAYIPTIGASGAVFGLLLAFGLLFPDVELLVFFFLPMKAKYLVVLYGGIEFFLLLSSGTNSSVSHIGHLGGLLFGIIFFLFTRRKRVTFSAKRIRATLDTGLREREKIIDPNAENSVGKLAAILNKLKVGGPDSISDDEFQFIKLADILYTGDENLCVPDDFDKDDDYCRKCDKVELCLIREIKKYL